MVDLRVGAQAAEAAKIGDTPEFKRKLAYFRDKLLLDDYLEQEAKRAVTPEAEHAIYDQTVKLMKPEEEVHARHILVDNEAEAKKIAARIKGGEDFAKVAAETSKDPGSKAEGGDLGWFTKERMVPDFANAAFAMKPGQVSDPVKTQFGWHVIKVEEKRTKPAADLRRAEGADRPAPDPQGAAGHDPEAARRGQDRAHRRGAGRRAAGAGAEEALSRSGRRCSPASRGNGIG